MQTEPANVKILLSRGTAVLNEHGVPNARRNAEWILCDALGMTKLDLYTSTRFSPRPDVVDTFWDSIGRRARREPLQYIIGNTEFMGLPLATRAGVFVPRPETELLVETAEQRLPLSARSFQLLDLCCGSGAIGVALAVRLPAADVTAVDVSADAVLLTQHNAAINQVAARVRGVRSEAVRFLSALHRSAEFDAILCNPPYIVSSQLPGLPPEVRDHEPSAALDGGHDGLDFYRAVMPALAARVRPGGFAAFEIGGEQATDVRALMESSKFTDVEVTKDFAGWDRVVAGVMPDIER